MRSLKLSVALVVLAGTALPATAAAQSGRPNRLVSVTKMHHVTAPQLSSVVRRKVAATVAEVAQRDAQLAGYFWAVLPGDITLGKHGHQGGHLRLCAFVYAQGGIIHLGDLPPVPGSVYYTWYRVDVSRTSGALVIKMLPPGVCWGVLPPLVMDGRAPFSTNARVARRARSGPPRTAHFCLPKFL